jgi:hypothetical protein
LDFTNSTLSLACCTTGIGVGLSSIVFSYCQLLASISLLSLLIFCSRLKLSSLCILESEFKHKTRSWMQFFKMCNKDKHVGTGPFSWWDDGALKKA